MSLGQKIANSLRNAFSYALHQESAADRDRKAGVAQALIEQSAPVIPADEAALRETLMQTRTRFLDALVEKKVAVGFDARLTKQVLDDRDSQIDGVYYAAKEGAGAIVTLQQQSGEGARRNGLLLEKLAALLDEVTPTIDLYAFTTFTMTMTPDMAVPVTVTSWATNGNERAPAVRKNPELRQPPVKAPGAPKPN